MNLIKRSVQIHAGGAALDADLSVPEPRRGVVLFAHGSGSSRHSPRNRYVAGELRASGLATVLADLLTRREEELDARTGRLRFDIDLLATRLTALTDWAVDYQATAGLPVGLFGASTGAAAALVTAAERPGSVAAVVSRGGRPDLAGRRLRAVGQPALLIVGALDTAVVELNRNALGELTGEARLELIAGASHLFPEPGALEQVARLARDWFTRHLGPALGPSAAAGSGRREVLFLNRTGRGSRPRPPSPWTAWDEALAAPRDRTAQAHRASGPDGWPPVMLTQVRALPVFDCGALFSALDAQRRDRGLDWSALAAELWQQSSELNARRADHPLCGGAIARLPKRGATSCQYALFMLRWLRRAPEDFLTGPVADVGDVTLPEAGTDSRLRWNLNQLHAALNEERRARGLTWAELAHELNCTPGRLTNLRTARLADMDLAMRVAQWLGQPAAAFIHPAQW